MEPRNRERRNRPSYRCGSRMYSLQRIAASVPEALLRLPPGGPPFAVWVRGAAKDAWECGVAVQVQGAEGRPLLMGRACYRGMLLPACIDLQQSASYSEYGGREVRTSNLSAEMSYNRIGIGWRHNILCEVEVLVLARGSAEWVEASEGDVPAHAFPVCQMPSGETAYAARVTHDGHHLIGRLLSSEGACTVIHDHKVMTFRSYEALVIV